MCIRDRFVAERGRGATLNGAPIRVSPTACMAESLLGTSYPNDIRGAVVAGRAADVVGIAGAEEALRHAGGGGHPDRSAVEGRSAAALGHEQLVAARIVDHSQREG